MLRVLILTLLMLGALGIVSAMGFGLGLLIPPDPDDLEQPPPQRRAEEAGLLADHIDRIH